MEKTKPLLNNKKSQSILGWFYIIVILFMTGIAVMVALIIINAANDTGVFEDVEEAQSAVNITRNTILSFDNIMLFVIVGLSLFVVISGALIFNHPAFFIISFVLLLIAITFAAVMSNAFWTFSTSSTIAATASNFPKIKFLMEKLPFYILFLGIAASIAMYVGYNRQ